MAAVDQRSASIDHLVVVARDLEQGGAWCEATLGITPGPGGEHPLMGTHNRLIKIATAEHCTAYLEIIAINPVATPSISTGARRWLDMDDSALQATVTQHGPTLAHWVVGVPDIAAALSTLAAQGIDRGAAVQASRPTPAGLLQWQISVRPDGQRLFDGCLPTLIEWGSTHPTQAMADCGVALHKVQVQHPQAKYLATALQALGLAAVPVSTGPARLCAQLQTPKGLVTLSSQPASP